jgi:3-methyladenine DNA glycosylase/8-oxoguanine DNA glycosylase
MLRQAVLRTLRGDPPGAAARSAGYPNAEDFRRECRRSLHVTPEALRGWGAVRRYRIEYGVPFHLEQTLGYLGRDPHNLAERVLGRRYVRLFPVAGGAVRVELHLGERSSTVHAPRPRSAEQALELHERLVRFLGLSQPLPAFYRAAGKHPQMGPLVRRFAGVRIPQLPTLWEALCWAVIGQQINLAFAYRLRNRLIAVAHGIPADSAPGEPLAFPDPRQVLRLSGADLLAQQFSRQKARYLLGLAEACDSGDLAALEPGEHDWPAVEARLLAQTGLGPWSAAYAMMRGLGYMDGLPVGDSGLRTALQRTFALKRPPTVKEQEELMAPFRPYRGLATYYLWKSLANTSTD